MELYYDLEMYPGDMLIVNVSLKSCREEDAFMHMSFLWRIGKEWKVSFRISSETHSWHLLIYFVENGQELSK